MTRPRPAIRWTAALALAAATAASAPPDEIDRYLEAQRERLRLPGLSVAVSRDGEIVKQAGYGFANLETRTPAAADTVYEIGSLTKQFTAVAAMLLHDEGRLDLDATIDAFFPAAPPAWRAITVRHLLTHTSGIQNHVAVPGYMDRFQTSLTGRESPSPDELLAAFFQLPLEFSPGETWAYDNTGYLLLGRIVEQVSGTPYWTYLAHRITTPLRLAATRDTSPRTVVIGRAAGYDLVRGEFVNRPALSPRVAFTAGAMLSTVGDLARWDSALAHGRLLSPASRERLWTPARLARPDPAPFDYGFGWFIGHHRGRRFIQHSGGTPGHSAIIYRFIEQRLTVVLACNRGDRILDQLAWDVAALAEPELHRPESAADPDPARTQRLRGVFTSLLAGRPDPDQFTPPMQKYLRTATGVGFWEWIAAHGQLTSFSHSETESSTSGRVARYRVGLDGNPYWFSFVLMPDDRIAQVTWW